MSLPYSLTSPVSDIGLLFELSMSLLLSPPDQSSDSGMRMLREFSTRDELSKALEIVSSQPELLPLQQSILLILSTPAAISSPLSLRLFAYPFDAPMYWFCLLLNKHDRPAILLLRHSEATMESGSSYSTALMQFLTEIAPSLRNVEAIYTFAENSLNYELLRLRPSLLPAHSSIKRSPYHLFYMNQEQMEKIYEIELQPPYGYSFGEATLQDDAELMASTSERKLSPEAIRERLCHLPSVLVRGPGGETASFAMTAETGSLTHLYTVPQHRRRGLAPLVELRLAQITARSGRAPFKVICTDNTSVHRWSEESPFWSILHRNGCPVEIAVQEMAIPKENKDDS